MLINWYSVDELEFYTSNLFQCYSHFAINTRVPIKSITWFSNSIYISIFHQRYLFVLYSLWSSILRAWEILAHGHQCHVSYSPSASPRCVLCIWIHDCHQKFLFLHCFIVYYHNSSINSYYLLIHPCWFAPQSTHVF